MFTLLTIARGKQYSEYCTLPYIPTPDFKAGSKVKIKVNGSGQEFVRLRSGRVRSTRTFLSYLPRPLRTVSSALQHPEIGAPRTDGLPILVGHHPRQLVHMC